MLAEPTGIKIKDQTRESDITRPLIGMHTFTSQSPRLPKWTFLVSMAAIPRSGYAQQKKYFYMVYVPEEAKLDYAQMSITGRADTWLRNSGVLEENLTYS
jgi:hypothetical protein